MVGFIFSEEKRWFSFTGQEALAQIEMAGGDKLHPLRRRLTLCNTPPKFQAGSKEGVTCKILRHRSFR
jgi:hypothetical protein